MSKPRHSASIDDTAASWVARCDRGPLSPKAAAALDAWLTEDSRHLGAYARAHAVYVHFDRARALGENFDPRAFEVNADINVSPSRRYFLKGMGATMAAAAAGFAGFAILQNPGRHVTTQLGEVLRLALEDGSAITLNSASEIVVAFGRTHRLVRLLRGEALFDVAKDLLRPFVVEVASDRVVAVGTSFTVQRAIDGVVEVMVQEGSVEFAHGVDTGGEQSVRLAANTLALAPADQRIAIKSMRRMEVSRRLAWRDGMISLDGDTLAQAAAQFARYSDTRIVIDDPAIAHRRVVGLYAASNPEGFARAVALSMNLRVERSGNVVRLEPASR